MTQAAVSVEVRPGSSARQLVSELVDYLMETPNNGVAQELTIDVWSMKATRLGIQTELVEAIVMVAKSTVGMTV